MKRLFSALGIAFGVLCLLGMVAFGVIAYPMLGEGREAVRVSEAIVAGLKDDWNEDKFAYYASPMLLGLNPKWRSDLATVREKLGKIKSSAPARNGKVLRDETVPDQTIYEVLIDVDCENGSAVIRMALARFQPGFQMTQFFVEEHAGNSR